MAARPAPPAPRAAARRAEPAADPALAAALARVDWRRVARHALTSRALDDAEETTNRNKATVPREHLVLYQFSARGHDVAQCVLGALLDHPHDAAGAYYRSRPLLLALGLSAEDALASPLGRSGGFSDGRDIGVVCNLPTRGGPMVLPMAGDVGGQYTPVAGWAQSVLYHRDELGDRAWDGALGVALGGEASVATSGFWSALTMATTLGLPVLFYVEDNGLGISVPSSFQTPGGNIAANLASFGNLFVRDGDGSDPLATALLLAEGVDHVRAGRGPALVRLTVPRLSSHSGPDNQKAYRTPEAIQADEARDPLPRLREFCLAHVMDEAAWSALEAEVAGDVDGGARRRARAPGERPGAGAALRRRRADAAGRQRGRGRDLRRRARRPGRHRRAGRGRPRAAVRRGRAAYARARARGQPQGRRLRRGRGRQGRRAPRHRGAAEALRRAARVRHVALRGGHRRPRGRDGVQRARARGRDPVPQVRRPGRRAAQQLRHRALADQQPLRSARRGPHARRLRQGRGRPVALALRRGALRPRPRLAGGDAERRVGRRGAAARGDALAQPDDLLRAPRPAHDERRQRPLPGRRLRAAVRARARAARGERITVVTWGALVHRCREAADALAERHGDDAVELIDLRTVAPWDRELVLASVRKTGRCLVVHEDTCTAGFGAEIAAVLARDAFWWLDAPVERYCVDDVPMPYHPSLLEAVLPSAEGVVARVEALLGV
jgi:2-oxoisovalerate dehydrogenase E1 component